LAADSEHTAKAFGLIGTRKAYLEEGWPSIAPHVTGAFHGDLALSGHEFHNKHFAVFRNIRVKSALIGCFLTQGAWESRQEMLDPALNICLQAGKTDE
jgi:hypothetical protein